MQIEAPASLSSPPSTPFHGNQLWPALSGHTPGTVHSPAPVLFFILPYRSPGVSRPSYRTQTQKATESIFFLSQLKASHAQHYNSLDRIKIKVWESERTGASSEYEHALVK